MCKSGRKEPQAVAVTIVPTSRAMSDATEQQLHDTFLATDPTGGNRNTVKIGWTWSLGLDGSAGYWFWTPKRAPYRFVRPSLKLQYMRLCVSSDCVLNFACVSVKLNRQFNDCPEFEPQFCTIIAGFALVLWPFPIPKLRGINTALVGSPRDAVTYVVVVRSPHSTNYGSVDSFLINDIDALVKLLSKL